MRQQHATANSRAGRSESLPLSSKNLSIACGSVALSQPLSVTSASSASHLR
jgi:hypothetical protein